MKEIQLTCGMVTLVDDADYGWLSDWKWAASTPNTKAAYAHRAFRFDGHIVKVLMHRLIMNAPPGMEVDHIDRNKLNNQRSNLRICRHGENEYNKPIRSHSKNPYKGVARKKGCWCVQIRANNKRYWIGSYATPEAAALAYNQAAIELHGEFASINQLPDLKHF